MASGYATIKAVASTRQQKPPVAKPAPLTAEHKKEKREAHEQRQAAINAEVDQ